MTGSLRLTRVYGFRPDAESGKKDIEEAWHLKRMPAGGWHNQSLRMLLHAGQVNAEAWAIHLSRLADHGRLDPVDDDPQVACHRRVCAEIEQPHMSTPRPQGSGALVLP